MIDPQIYQICVYIYVVMVESFGSHWMISVMPQIVTHDFKTSDKNQISTVGGYYFTFYLAGLITGAFLWPIIVKYISQRDCILIGILGQAFSNFMVGQALTLRVLWFWRFLFGLFHVINTIGKDFLYKFAHHKYRQFIFILRSMAVMISSFFGPIIGYFIYYGTGQDFALTLNYISLIMVTSLFLFMLAFYVFSPKHHTIEHHEDDEVLYLHPVLSKEESEVENQHRHLKQIGLIDMVRYCLRRKSLRNEMIGFFFLFSVYNAQIFISIFFIESPWEDQGLGLNDKTVSIIVVLIFVPILVIFLIAWNFVPRKISLFTYCRLIILINAAFLILLPGLRDIFNNSSYSQRITFIYLVLGFHMIFNPNLLSPFLNFHMNNQVPKNGRTSFNSITFIGTAFFAMALFATLIPFFSISLYDPSFQKYRPYNKYFCFVITDVLLIIGAFFLRGHKTNRINLS